MSDLHILILAAGRATRMRGADKLLEPVGGQPLLRRIAQMALDLSAPVHVVLPAPDPSGQPTRAGREQALRGLAVRIIDAPFGTPAMGASLSAGIAGLTGDAGAVMVLLGDMPEIDAKDLRRMAKAYAEAPRDRILRGAGAEGQPGHPVIFPSGLFSDLRGLAHDQGASDIIRAQSRPPLLVPLPDRHALTDLDTPEEWADWRAAFQPASGPGKSS